MSQHQKSLRQRLFKKKRVGPLPSPESTLNQEGPPNEEVAPRRPKSAEPTRARIKKFLGLGAKEHNESGSISSRSSTQPTPGPDLPSIPPPVTNTDNNSTQAPPPLQDTAEVVEHPEPIPNLKASANDTEDQNGENGENVGSSEWKENVKALGSFTKLLLKRLPEFAEWNPVKVAFGIAKLVVEIKDGVGDNLDVVERRIEAISAQLGAIQEVLEGWESEDGAVKSKVLLFAKAIKNELVQFEKMRAQSLLKRIATVEGHKAVLAETFERINEARIQLQLTIGIKTFKAIGVLEESTKVLILDRLQPSHLANHNFQPEGERQQILRRGICTPGTRIRQLTEVIHWANNPESEYLYWLFGPAGSGKSTIAYTVACRLEGGLDTGDKLTLGASFFCSRQFEETKHETRIVRTLAYQLATKCKAFAEALAHANQFDVIHHNVRSQIDALLSKPWEQTRSARDEDPLRPSHYLLVIDALDEIEGDGGTVFLLALLDAIREGHLQGLKFFATSRPDPRVVSRIESFREKKICRLQDVPIEEAEADIQTYLEFSLPLLADSELLPTLAKLSDGLFILAATVTKRLLRFNYSQREQLRLLAQLLNVLSKPDESVPRSPAGSTLLLDELYRQVLDEAFGGLDEDMRVERILILHTLLSTTERISAPTVANLLCNVPDLPINDTPVDSQTVEMVVDSLYSVLYIHNGVILSYHKSFPDFIFNESRSKLFWCNGTALQPQLATSCLHIKAHGLKFNIADIPSSFVLDRDNPSLSNAIKANIPPPLSYACRSWDVHLSLSPKSLAPSFSPLVSEFLQLRVLFWIETMNLLRLSHLCEPKLERVRTWFVDDPRNAELCKFLSEASMFSTHFSGTPASHSTPHLYISSLATWPRRTSLSQNWRRHFPHIPVFIPPSIPTPLFSIQTHGGEGFSSFCLSKDEQSLFIGCVDGTIRVWDLRAAEWSMIIHAHTGRVEPIIISEDGRYCASCAGSTIQLCTTADGKEVCRLDEIGATLCCMAFTKGDGSQLVALTNPGTMSTWDIVEGVGAIPQPGPDPSSSSFPMVEFDSCDAAALSRNGKRVVSFVNDSDIAVRVRDATTGTKLSELVVEAQHPKHGYDPNPISQLAISDDGELYAVGLRKGTVGLHSVADPTRPGVHLEFPHPNDVGALQFLPNNILAVASLDRDVFLLNTTTGAMLASFPVYSDTWTTTITSTKDGRRLLTGDGSGLISVWDVSTLEGSIAPRPDQNTWGKTDVRYMAFSKDGKCVLSCTELSSVQVWNVSTGAEVAALMAEPEDHVGRRQVDPLTICALSDDASIAATGSRSGTLYIWRVSTKDRVTLRAQHSDKSRTEEPETCAINCLNFCADSRYLVSGSGDGWICVWDVAEATQVSAWKCPGLCSMAISANGLTLVTISLGGLLQTFNVGTWEEMESTTLPSYPRRLGWTPTSLPPIAFSRDGRRVAVVFWREDEVEVVRVWDLSAPNGFIDRHPELYDSPRVREIQFVALSDDGSRFAVARGRGNILYIGNISPAKESEVRALRGLSEIPGNTPGVDYFKCFVFAPDGNHILTGASDGCIRLWSLAPRSYCRQRLRSDGKVTDLALTDVTHLYDPERSSCHPSTINPDEERLSGWLVSPSGSHDYLLYAPLFTNVPHASIIHVFPPRTQTATVDLSNVADVLGPCWARCYQNSL